MQEVLSKYGRQTYYDVVDELLDHGERIARDGLARIPDGTYVYEDFLDDDGVRVDIPVRLHCAVTIAGSEMTVDLSGSADTQAGPVNCPWGYTLMTARFSLKRFVSGDTPANGGEYRPLKVVARPGCLFNPLAPAPC